MNLPLALAAAATFLATVFGGYSAGLAIQNAPVAQPLTTFGALSILKGSQGGTGLGTATAGDVGKVLQVSDNDPLTYIFATDQTGGGGGSFPFSADTNYGQVVYSTSTPTLWLKSGLFASSTSRLTSATTTTLGVSGTGTSTVLDGGVQITGTPRFIEFFANSLNPTSRTGLTFSENTAGGANLAIGYDGSLTGGNNRLVIWSPDTNTDLFIFNKSGTSSIPFASSTAITVGNILSTNATTTSLNATGQVQFDGLTSALILTGSTGILAEYTGIDCTNQFVRDVSAAGAGTCASVSLSADVTGSLALTSLAAQAANTVIANGTGGSAVPTAIATSTLFGSATPGNVLAFTGGVWAPMATATCLQITGSADLCDGSDATAAGAANDFTFASNFARIMAATTSPLWAQTGIYASSTSQLSTTTIPDPFTLLLGTATTSKQSQGGGGPENIGIQRAAANNLAIWSGVTNDIEGRWLVEANGLMGWGAGGASDQDINFYRSGAGALTIQSGTTNSTDAFRVNQASGGTGTAVLTVNTTSAYVATPWLLVNGAGGGAKLDVYGGGTTAIRAEQTAATDVGFSAFVTGDAHLRFSFLADGTLKWGSGSAVSDTNLYRPAANSLQTDDLFITSGGLLVNAASSTITGNLQISTSSLSTFVTPYYTKTFSYASSTQGMGTTTRSIGVAPAGLTLKTIECDFNNFMRVVLHDGTNRTNDLIASSTIGKVTFTTNNTFSTSEAMRLDVGTTSNLGTNVFGSCTAKYVYN